MKPAASSPAPKMVLPYGSAFPLEAWPAIRAFVKEGGGLVVLGGAPLGAGPPVVQEGRTAAVAVAAGRTRLVLFERGPGRVLAATPGPQVTQADRD